MAGPRRWAGPLQAAIHDLPDQQLAPRVEFASRLQVAVAGQHPYLLGVRRARDGTRTDRVGLRVMDRLATTLRIASQTIRFR